MSLELAKRNKTQDIEIAYFHAINSIGTNITTTMGNTVKIVTRAMVQDYDDAYRKLDTLGESSMMVLSADGTFVTLLKSEIKEVTDKAIVWGVQQFEKKYYLFSLIQNATTEEEVNAITW